MRFGMLGQALSCPEDDVVRDCFGAGTPALICMFVDVAMIAGKIAPAVHFEHDFAEWDQGSCHSLSLASMQRESERGTEGRRHAVAIGRRGKYPAELPGGFGGAGVDLGERHRFLLRNSEGARGFRDLHGSP
ncbi:hypothetical protein GCM10015535_21880 [Streptomyces gelaticus]|uniref:Uncharacterized protein n=1 Tax=Streptomyces gelaticus TaxID=285446 RepID=A0ABQ2VYF7_9ACTN|nr:hypothetical protein GCM10015535_21880 [Streptomyces gelaticus]